MKIFLLSRPQRGKNSCVLGTVWKVSQCWVSYGLYFPVFRLNAGKYGPEKTPYFDAFHAVGKYCLIQWNIIEKIIISFLSRSSQKSVQRLIKVKTNLGYGIKI